jgi:transcriptional regulator with XRE-family HTH domain
VNEHRPRTLLGALIRQQREVAQLPMRELAKIVGISNPYLSQIERGLRAPSDAVLKSIAETLEISADDLYKRAGFVERTELPEGTSADLGAAIEAATELTASQRRALLEIYRNFLDANLVRRAHTE